MLIVAILLITVAILTLLSGVATFFGVAKKEKLKTAWFLLATIFATVWTMMIAIFLVADANYDAFMPVVINITYISALFIDIMLLGFINWENKRGRVVAWAFVLLGVILAIAVTVRPSLLHYGAMYSGSGNSILLNVGPFYYIYIAFFCVLVPTVMVTLLRKYIHSTTLSNRGADLVLLVGFGISGITSLVVNLILPFWTWEYIWLGPLTISATIIAFYYSVLRYRIVDLNSKWLRVLSFIVVVASLAVVYMVIFYVIFMAMFRGASPSIEVIVLNFIMILIVIALIPATNELNAFIRSLISHESIDMVYMIKKLSKVSPKDIEIHELAGFLAEHMHFEYVGILVKGRVYGSDHRKVSPELSEFVKGLGDPEYGIWQEVDSKNAEWKKNGFSAVAALKNGSGKTFSQVIIGKPLGKNKLTRRDKVQVETVINLVAIIIDSKTARRD